MKRFVFSSVTLLSLAALAFAMPASRQASPPATNTRAGSHTVSSANHNTARTGEEVFKANCSRCHMPPMSISPRITGTIVLHMRARARLSSQDEKLLLEYLAP